MINLFCGLGKSFMVKNIINILLNKKLVLICFPTYELIDDFKEQCISDDNFTPYIYDLNDYLNTHKVSDILKLSSCVIISTYSSV